MIFLFKSSSIIRVVCFTVHQKELLYNYVKEKNELNKEIVKR